MFKREFDRSYVGFTKDGAKWLVDNTDIKLVGKLYTFVSSLCFFFVCLSIFYLRCLQKKTLVFMFHEWGGAQFFESNVVEWNRLTMVINYTIKTSFNTSLDDFFVIQCTIRWSVLTFLCVLGVVHIYHF